ncbi:MAG: SDR family oxidoreductase [Deltaproteobacteria bacterium]|nr:SDR family oxidoreductase [Deltaproteobacteria bacterium]
MDDLNDSEASAPVESIPPARERVLVIGAAGGIGQALVARLAARGASLVLAGRRLERVQAVAATYGAEALALDATRLDDVMEAVARASAVAPLTGIVNLAGAILLKPAHRTSEREWLEVLGQNLGTAFACVRAAGQHLGAVAGRPASLVLVSSAAASIGLANHEAIAASKAGVEGLVRSAAATYARRGLRVNAVAPGLVRTPLAGQLATEPRMLEASNKMHPLGRIGEPADVASGIAWLLDPETSWVTGQVLGIDGGLATLKPPTVA